MIGTEFETKLAETFLFVVNPLNHQVKIETISTARVNAKEEGSWIYGWSNPLKNVSERAHYAEGCENYLFAATEKGTIIILKHLKNTN